VISSEASDDQPTAVLKGGHADRVAVLAGHQVADNGFEVGLIDIGFRKCGSQVSETIDGEINGLIVEPIDFEKGKAGIGSRPRTSCRPSSIP
jgi:hypothetical protein